MGGKRSDTVHSFGLIRGIENFGIRDDVMMIGYGGLYVNLG